MRSNYNYGMRACPDNNTLLNCTCLVHLCSNIKIILEKPGPEIIKLFSCSTEISNAHKSKKYQEIQLSSDSDKPRMLFFLLINVKMPTIVDILTFMSRKNLMLS